MLNCNSLSVDNKAVKYMTIDGKIVYSTDPDYSYSLYGVEDVTLSSFTTTQAAGSYTLPDGGTYTYDIHEVPAAKFWGSGTGTDRLFPISEHIFARAAHWGNVLTSFYVGNTNYFTRAITELVNLPAWAKNNGFDADYVDSLHVDDIQLVYITDDVISAGTYTEDDIPYIIPEI